VVSGVAGPVNLSSSYADISSSPVQLSPEEGSCASVNSEDICGSATDGVDVIVGSSFGGTENPAVSASVAKRSSAPSNSSQMWKPPGRRITVSAYLLTAS
jgi:hypothetical protein